MKKIELSVKTTTVEVDSKIEEMEHEVFARCKGRDIEFNLKSLVSASLQLPKGLGVVLYQDTNKLTVKVYFDKKSKCYNLELTSEELADVNSLESSMRKLTEFIRSIERDTQSELANTTVRITELEFGGNGQY
jgi:hypothetical protein